MSLRKSAEVDFREVPKPAEILAEPAAEVCGSLRNHSSQVFENTCGGLRKCCGSNPPLIGATSVAAPKGLGAPVAPHIHITRHSIERAIERLPFIRTEDEARALLSREVIERAAEFAGHAQCFVRLVTGHRVTVRDWSVITVLPAEDYRRTVRRVGRGRFE